MTGLDPPYFFKFVLWKVTYSKSRWHLTNYWAAQTVVFAVVFFLTVLAYKHCLRRVFVVVVIVDLSALRTTYWSKINWINHDLIIMTCTSTYKSVSDVFWAHVQPFTAYPTTDLQVENQRRAKVLQKQQPAPGSEPRLHAAGAAPGSEQTHGMDLHSDTMNGLGSTTR